MKPSFYFCLNLYIFMLLTSACTPSASYSIQYEWDSFLQNIELYLGTILFNKNFISYSNYVLLLKLVILTTVGTNGGGILRCSNSSHWICLKNACFLTSSASLSLEPNLLSGLFRKSCKLKLNSNNMLDVL